jgi:hypothetical protein
MNEIATTHPTAPPAQDVERGDAAMPDDLDLTNIAIGAAYKVNATRVHELGGDSLTIFKEPELCSFVREVYAAIDAAIRAAEVKKQT